MTQFNRNPQTKVPFNNFSGGMASSKLPGSLDGNEALDVDNIILGPQGKSFRKRLGNTEFNSTAMASGAACQGLGFSTAGGTEYLIAVCGGQVFKSDSLDGTMDDIDGSASITSGATNRWTIFDFNDEAILVGVNETVYKWTGTGNMSALGGTPGNQSYGFANNNRAFFINGSTIKWSVLDDASDTSGTGSGSKNVGADDGQDLVTAIPMTADYTLLLKDRDVHAMTGNSSPFSFNLVFKDAGCVGKHAAVYSEGLAYWISNKNQPRLIISDGTQIKKTSRLNNVDDIWAAANKDNLQYLEATVQRGQDYHWIVFGFAKDSSSTNNHALIWDVTNECWLQCSTGYNGNAFATTNGGDLYMAAGDGKIYKMAVAATYTDASNSDTAIQFKYRSDWLGDASLKNIVRVEQFNLLHQTNSAGTITLNYGYDYREDQASRSIPLQVSGAAKWGNVSVGSNAKWGPVSASGGAIWGGGTDRYQNANSRLLGRGNAFQYYLTSSSEVPIKISAISLSGRATQGQKDLRVI